MEQQLRPSVQFGPGAEVRVSKSQLVFMVSFIVLGTTLGLLLQLSLLQYIQGFVAVSTLFFTGMVVFSLGTAISGIREGSLIEVTDTEVEELKRFPFVSVIVPAFKEGRVASQLVASLGNLNYPISQYEVIIVLEEGDIETIEAFQIRKPKNFQVVVRPRGGIMTKPAAMNYLLLNGFLSPRSKVVVVFDAEDKPDPNQIRKAIIAFMKGWEIDKSVVCIQARLAFSQNSSRNWLTRMLNLDYLQHFGLVLPGLSMLGMISPLGGTSNYILTQVLEELGGWDPMNVTEDLDLAVMLARTGKKVRVLNSVTSEEAVTRVQNLFAQRSRWIKGGIQTYFRHMRNPAQLKRDLGWVGFIGFQCVVGAPLVLYLINPIFWGMTIVYAITGSEFIQSLYPPLVFYLAMFCFAVGNYMYIYLLKAAAFKTGQYTNVVFAFFAPMYWVLLSIAAYKAVFEFSISKKKATSWSKTSHEGVSVQ